MMSLHFLSQINECKNTDEFVKLLIPTLRNGKITVKRKLTEQEKRKLRAPADYVTQLVFYEKGEAKIPFEQKHKIILHFQRMYHGNNYKYQMAVGKYSTALENQDMRDTYTADFIANRKPYSGTVIENLKIPMETIEKLNPEIIDRNGTPVAVIELTQEQVNRITPYSNAGNFLWKLTGYLRFHAGEKTEKDKKILESYFKGQKDGVKTYLPEFFEKFIRSNQNQLKEIINSEKTKEKIADEVSRKYGIQLSGYKIESFAKLENYLKRIPKTEKQAMLKEIEEIQVRR